MATIVKTSKSIQFISMVTLIGLLEKAEKLGTPITGIVYKTIQRVLNKGTNTKKNGDQTCLTNTGVDPENSFKWTVMAYSLGSDHVTRTKNAMKKQGKTPEEIKAVLDKIGSLPKSLKRINKYLVKNIVTGEYLITIYNMYSKYRKPTFIDQNGNVFNPKDEKFAQWLKKPSKKSFSGYQHLYLRNIDQITINGIRYILSK